MMLVTRYPIRSAVVVALLAAGVAGLFSCTALKRFAYSGFDRDDWQQPERVVAALGLAPGDRVADVGAGGGYFTFRLARAVGSGGRVYAVDIDDGLLDYIEDRAKDEGLSQIVRIDATTDDTGLADASVDLIFLSNTFHHIEERSAYFARARTRLRPGGRVAVIEGSSDDFPSGHTTSADEIRTDMQAAGFELAAQHHFLDRQSFQIFRPRGQ